MQGNREDFSEQTIHDVTLVARQRFAANNGWQVAKRGFSIQKLATRKLPEFVRFGWEPDMTVLDHVEHFRHGRRPIALVAHPYGEPRDRAERLAAKLGLQVICCAQSSWWYPSISTMVVFTAPGTTVVMPTDEEIEENTRRHAAWDAGRERRRLAREQAEVTPRP
jgi:hypothetical protein